MVKYQIQENFTSYEKVYELLSSLESIVKLTLSYCQDKELQSVYYNLLDDEKFILSNERNHYINMLSLSLERITELKNLNNFLEENFFRLKQYTNNCS